MPTASKTSLYTTLELEPLATSSAIKLAYHRLALVHHPDKLRQGASTEEVDAANEKFQAIGLAYAVLKDEKRRERYDRTGSTDEAGDEAKTEAEWKEYFKELWQGEVNAETLDEFKKKYQGSDEERQDLYTAYTDSRGSLDSILSNVMCSTLADEDRFISLINDAIASSALPATPLWTKSSTSKPAKLARHKKAQKEAAEAESYAKELGIHDKLYGDKSNGAKGGKGKGKGNVNEDGVDEEALKAVIMAKAKGREDRMDAMLAGLKAKYGPKGAKGGAKGKGKKRQSGAADQEASEGEEDKPRVGKKGRVEEEPSEEDFQRIQAEIDARRASNKAANPTPARKGRKSI